MSTLERLVNQGHITPGELFVLEHLGILDAPKRPRKSLDPTLLAILEHVPGYRESKALEKADKTNTVVQVSRSPGHLRLQKIEHLPLQRRLTVSRREVTRLHNLGAIKTRQEGNTTYLELNDKNAFISRALDLVKDARESDDSEKYHGGV